MRVAARLDADAVDRLVGSLAGARADVDPATRIKVDDLVAAGWSVEGPTVGADGGLDVVATRRYSDVEELRSLLAAVGGQPGPFREVVLSQHRGFLKTTTEFRGAVDLGGGLDAFTDPDLKKALEATSEAPLGVTAEQLEQHFGAPLDRLLGLEVALRLPGAADSNAPTAADGAAVWEPSLGQRVALAATSEQWNRRNIAATGVALLATLGLLAVVVLRLRRRQEAPDPTT